MKIHLTSLVCTLTLISSGFSQQRTNTSSTAQGPGPQIENLIAQATPSRGRTTSTGTTSTRTSGRTAAKVLSKNYAITVSGEYVAGKPLEVTLTGSGTKFIADIPPAKAAPDDQVPGTTGTVELELLEQSGKVVVTYTLGYRYAVKSGNKVEFRDAILRGTIRCTLAKKMEIFRSGDRSVSITVEDVKEE